MTSVATLKTAFDLWNAGVQRSIAEYHRREVELEQFSQRYSVGEIPDRCKSGKHQLSEASVLMRNGSWRCMPCQNEATRRSWRRAHPKRPPVLKIGAVKRAEMARKYKAGVLVRDLAAEYRVSRPTVIRMLRLAQVPIRGQQESARMAQPKGYSQLSTEQRLAIVARYINREGSSDLAEEFGVSPMTILRTLRSARVPRRSKSESLKISYENRRTRTGRIA